MNTQQKYYCPDISEFYEGFEYEFKERMGNYSKNKFRVTKLNDALQHYLDRKMIRVKYLDQQDIESLGWDLGISFWERDTNERVNVVRLKSIADNSLSFQKIITETQTYSLTMFDNLRVVIVKNYLSDHKTGLILKNKMIHEPKNIMVKESLFDGIIKNKSELKKIMQQLNISQ